MRAYIGVGANLASPQTQVLDALQALAQLDQSQRVAHASLWRSAPVGYTNQPDFINTVAMINTSLSAHELLQALHHIEATQGRTREFTNAPRTLDLDLLLYENLVCDEATLKLPHPRMHLRAFVLRPLAELDPHAQIPGQAPLSTLLERVATQDCTRLTSIGHA